MKKSEAKAILAALLDPPNPPPRYSTYSPTNYGLKVADIINVAKFADWENVEIEYNWSTRGPEMTLVELVQAYPLPFLADVFRYFDKDALRELRAEYGEQMDFLAPYPTEKGKKNPSKPKSSGRDEVVVQVQGHRITGRACVWDLLTVPKQDHRSPRGHERFTAQARVVATLAKNGRWVSPADEKIVTLTLSPADVLAWQMAGGELTTDPPAHNPSKLKYKLSASDLDTFVESYLHALLWQAQDEDGGGPLSFRYSIDDFTKKSVAQVKKDAKAFLTHKVIGIAQPTREEYRAMTVAELIDEYGRGDFAQAGHDFMLTRSGSGGGFWDGDWAFNVPGSPADLGYILTEVSHQYRNEGNVYAERGKLYAE